MRIRFTDEELKKCKEFSDECAKNQQDIEFGQSDTAPRNMKEIGRDNLIGKIAEVAFAKMLKEHYGIEVKLDFNFYPRGVWDKKDAEINGWNIDIKGTRQGGRWLLIEWNKLDFRQREDNLSHLYVMASVHWDRDTDSPTGTVDLVGCALINSLMPGVEKTKILRKGDYIPNTHTKLQADNYGIHFDNLITNWDNIIERITSEPPPDTSNYPNPYNWIKE